MLKELVIRQFAIIEEVRLQFKDGFHVLTGETGAGKSILIDALGLVIGGRASADFVRYGEEKAEIEALFEVSSSHPAHALLREWGFADDELDSLIIRREITVNGKSVCRINGRTITLAMLKQMGQTLLDISGQHEHQALLRVEEHLAWLDTFAGSEVIELREQYESRYREYQALKKELARYHMDQKELAYRVDMLQFQAQEIEAAALVPGEEEELEQERNRLAHAEKLMMHTAHAYQHLNGEQGGLERVQEALNHLEGLVEVDESLGSLLENVQSAYYQLEEAARAIGRYRDGFEFDPGRLNEVEERLHLIKQLKRKYGESIADILAHGEKVRQELNQLEHREESVAELEEKISSIEAELHAMAKTLTQLRKEAAAQLETKVEQELADLNMASTVFHVAFYSESYQANELLPHGQDVIEFQIAPNPGEPLKPLTKIASGGELSRIMLALKCIFTATDSAHTLVFDEIDTGVSGRAAQAIAEKIAVVSKQNQILCVTHLPQVACMADHHFYISKELQDDKTRTKVEPLDRRGRTMELARMLGGVEVTNRTMQHAEEMIRMAEKVKRNR
ncbi:DNA repair protein RecN [Laceyella putida]|jgi:DNA repair protein RecN (Recombination protein N)|uniref:DNA repair protein RecN n=1 Tax=Laceyella putida TaxID=110101 RepID=A0ABW2RIY3_9BACL